MSKLTNENLGDIEALLETILTGGLEVKKSLSENCDWKPEDNQSSEITEEVDRLLMLVKKHNELD